MAIATRTQRSVMAANEQNGENQKQSKAISTFLGRVIFYPYQKARLGRVEMGLFMSKKDSLKTHCPRGHAYTGDNLYIDYRNKRYCKLCRKNHQHRLTQQKKYWLRYPPSKTKRDPIKERARRMAREAVRSGKIIKPNACETCKKVMDKRKIHGHHRDYGKPLDVVFLCSICHAKEHHPPPRDAIT